MIKANNCVFIKLGQNGEFEKNCIEQDQTLRLSYREFDHQACLDGKWDKVLKICRDRSKSEAAAKNHLTQLKLFYESGEKTLWFTFYKGKLYWTFASPKITQLEDKTKIRKCVGKWSCKDSNGHDLNLSSLSGKLTKTKGFRGTVNQSKVPDYIIQRLNGLVSPNVKAAQDNLGQLESSLEKLICDLTPQDFELLVEVIFSNTGWIRIGDAGKQEKDIDLELVSPVLNESVVVQIKSQTDQRELEQYIERIEDWKKDRFFFVYHTSKGKLKLPAECNLEVNLVDSKQLAKLAISAGLSNWIIDKAS